MRIVVSGGGTVGHVSPVLATVDALRRRDSSLELRYIGQRGGIEAGLAKAAGLSFIGVYGGKYRRIAGTTIWGQISDIQTLLLNLRDLVAIIAGTVECLWHLGQFRPDVIFNKVGPAGLPVGLAARILGIPMVIHEPDVIPGLANRTLSGWATKIAVGFPAEYYQRFPQAKVVVTGTPVQMGETAGAGERKATRERLGFKAGRPLIVITGGSQGAVALNTAIIKILPQLLKTTQVYHLTGKRDYDRVVSRTHDSSSGYRAEPQVDIQDIKRALAAADLVVARAGAATIAELAILAKPTILVPNREAAAHQIANATALEEGEAAVVVRDTEPPALLTAITTILGSRSQQHDLSTHIASFAHPDAADRLAHLIIAVATRGTAA